MSEIIFVLIILYVVYVIKVSCNEKKETGLDLLGSAEEAVSKTEENSVEVQKPKPSPKKAAPVAKKATPAPAAKKAEVLSDGKKIPGGSLRNPETGEETKMANSYRMSKRWIKEALVTEGLLGAVYKTSEVDDAKKVEINLAFEKLMKIDKYKA
jgi:hypothetical protein